MRAARLVDVAVVREWINLATVPPSRCGTRDAQTALRSPTRLTAARKKKSGSPVGMTNQEKA